MFFPISFRPPRGVIRSGFLFDRPLFCGFLRESVRPLLPAAPAGELVFAAEFDLAAAFDLEELFLLAAELLFEAPLVVFFTGLEAGFFLLFSIINLLFSVPFIVYAGVIRHSVYSCI